MRAAGVVRHSAEARRRTDARRRPRLASRVRRHGIPHRRLLLLLLWGCASALPALDQSASAAQSAVAALENRSWEIHAVRIDAPLDLDGRLDDEAWQRATPITEFYQRERNEGIPATEATEVRILYDGDNLYIGWRCFDSDPSRSTHRAIFRDESAGADDLVAIMLDAYHGHRSAVQFISNANGLVFELLQNGESESTRNSDYNTVWTSKGSRNDRGFDVEMVIPFKSLRFPRQPGGQEVVFGIGFKRNIPRKNEEVTWPFVSNDSSWYRPAELGHLRGLVDIQPGHNLEVRPYALGGGLRDGAANETTGRRDAGFDVKWGVTTGLTADFTVNTDFAQEEADVQQVNFTRFSLFFPEKRQFFLEGQQMFQFGVPREADLTFTRRIGLSPEGTIVPITAGARVSGRQGRTSIGAMTIQTRDEGDIEGQNFSVLRVRRDILSRSSIGALFTNVQDAGSANRVIGADANIYFKRVWFAEGFVARTSETGLRARGAEYGRFAYSTDRREVSYRYLAVDDGFNPGVGFVRRPDSRSHSAQARWSPRPKSRLVRQYHATGTVGYITSHEQVLETRERSAQFTVDFETGDSVTMQTTDEIDKDFFPDAILLRWIGSASRHTAAEQAPHQERGPRRRPVEGDRNAAVRRSRCAVARVGAPANGPRVSRTRALPVRPWRARDRAAA